MRKIIVFDTTLRDGEQSPGFSMNVSEKVSLAEQLSQLGVDVIEGGFPVASNDDFEAVRQVASAICPFGELVRPRENISLASQTTEWRMPRKRPSPRRSARPARA